MRCGWFSSARRDSGSFLKTAALFYTCLFLSGWLDWRAEINITWRRSLHVQCIGAESQASLPWLLKGVGHLPCPEGQTHTCMHTQIQPADSFPSTAYQDADASSTLFHQRLAICVSLMGTFLWEDWFLYHLEAEFITVYGAICLKEIDRRVGRPRCPTVAFLSCCGCCLFSLSLVYILNVCWKSLTS